jgi:hypothetical protein
MVTDNACRHTDFTYTNKRNQKLFATEYLPAASTPIQAALVFHQGYGEHVGRKASGKQSALKLLVIPRLWKACGCNTSTVRYDILQPAHT